MVRNDCWITFTEKESLPPNIIIIVIINILVNIITLRLLLNGNVWVSTGASLVEHSWCHPKDDDTALASISSGPGSVR